MYYLTDKSSISEIQIFGEWFGNHLRPLVEHKSYDHFCSDLINSNFLSRLFTVISIFRKDPNEFLNDEYLLGTLVVNKYAMDALLVAVEKWSIDGKLNVLLTPAFCEKSMSGWYKSIETDFSCFMYWVIWHGGDGASVRKYLCNSAIKSMNKLRSDKNAGDEVFITILYRSLIAYNIIMEKQIIPKFNELVQKRLKREEEEYNEMTRELTEDNNNIKLNSLSAAFSCLAR